MIAPSEDAARHALDQHGVAAMSVWPESRGAAAMVAPFDQVVQAALDEAGVRIRFDQLPRRHEGRSIWVLDRQRVRGRVTRIVNEAIGHDDSRRHLAVRVEQVIEASFEPPPPSTAAAPAAPADALAIAGEVDRLAAALAKIERAMASMSAAARLEPRRPAPDRAARDRDRARNEMLTEIFMHNLELVRAIGGPA